MHSIVFRGEQSTSESLMVLLWFLVMLFPTSVLSSSLEKIRQVAISNSLWGQSIHVLKKKKKLYKINGTKWTPDLTIISTFLFLDTYLAYTSDKIDDYDEV